MNILETSGDIGRILYDFHHLSELILWNGTANVRQLWIDAQDALRRGFIKDHLDNIRY